MLDTKELPLIVDDRQWIERPDYFVWAMASAPDTEDIASVQQIYKAMCQSDNQNPELSAFDIAVLKVLNRNIDNRLYAGTVLLAFVHLGTMGRKLSLGEARRLAAQIRRQKKRSGEDTNLRAVRDGSSAYRNTSHLQAAALLCTPTIREIENSPEQLNLFLGIARHLEILADKFGFKWAPWRVPACIDPVPFSEWPDFDGMVTSSGR